MGGVKLGKLRQGFLERAPQSTECCRPFFGKLVLDAHVPVEARPWVGEGILKLGLNAGAPNLNLSH